MPNPPPPSDPQKLPGTFKAFVSKFPELAAAHEAVAAAVA